MRRKKFNGFRTLTDWKWFFVLPAVIININEPIFCVLTTRISLHWLGWHCSWLWIEKERVNERRSIGD